MKKSLILGLILVVGFACNAHAGRVAKVCKTYTITASSSTATQALASNSTRVAVIITNNGSYSVYLATSAATSSTNLQVLGVGKTFSDSGQPYNGAWYVLTEAGYASQNVRATEVSE